MKHFFLQCLLHDTNPEGRKIEGSSICPTFLEFLLNGADVFLMKIGILNLLVEMQQKCNKADGVGR